MTTTSLKKIGRSALLFSPIPIAAVGYITLLYVFRPQNTAIVLTLAAAMSIFVMVYAGYLARRVARKMDEVQLANMGYATAQGWVWGMGITILLLLVPPVTNLLIDLASRMTTGTTDRFSRASMLIALNFGFMLLVLMQTACNIVASKVWHRRMSMPKQ